MEAALDRLLVCDVHRGRRRRTAAEFAGQLSGGLPIFAVHRMQRSPGYLPFLREQVQFLVDADRGRVAVRTTKTGDHQSEPDFEDQSLHRLCEDRIGGDLRACCAFSNVKRSIR